MCGGKVVRAEETGSRKTLRQEGVGLGKEKQRGRCAWGCTREQSSAGRSPTASTLCCACFIRHPYAHLGHTRASYGKAASFKLQGLLSDIPFSKLHLSSPDPGVGLEWLLLSHEPDTCCDESSSHQRAPCINLSLISMMLGQLPALSCLHAWC